MTPLEVLFEDNHCLVVNKPAGLLSMGDETGDASLVAWAMEDLRIRHQKPGNVYVGLVHRLDRPVSGVMLLAKTSKAASRLAAQFREREPEKTYLTLTEGTLHPASGELVDWLVKDNDRNHTRVAGRNAIGAKEAKLKYRLLGTIPSLAPSGFGSRTLVEVQPLTGRSHQIRVQLAHAGAVIVGDLRYGSQCALGAMIALHARSLTFEHPVKHEPVTVQAPLPSTWQPLLGDSLWHQFRTGS